MVLVLVIRSHDHSRKISLISSQRNYPSLGIFSLFDIKKKKILFLPKEKEKKCNNFRDLEKHFLKH